jgi:endonuclease YncB( thermonuclease family)
MTRLTILTLSLLLSAEFVPAAEWEKWEDCRMATYEYYDGDSFHVVKGGKDKIFRLYAVDTAETSDEHPDRIKEQQAFFRATKEEILSAGDKATEFTRRLLQKPFTVETQWIDAKGASRAQRFFAKITLSDGSDLGFRLVEAGLARVYGMREGLTGSYLGKLDQAQASARRSRLGLWGGNEKVSMPEEAETEEDEVKPLDDSDVVGTQSLFDRLQQESAVGAE